jgi:hypothetical protein
MSRSLATPFLDDFIPSCVDILDELCSHPIAEIFLNPVDPELDNVPTYLDVVKHPSDLGTVRQRLLARKYANIDDFEREVNQIWENAILFNGRTSLISAMAAFLGHIFQKRLALLRTASHEAWMGDYLKSQTTMCKLFRAQPAVLEEFNLSPDLEMLVPERKMARSWLTPEDAQFFAQAFKFVEEPTQLAKMIHILTENEPTIDFSEPELQINLAALSQRTIRLLKGFMSDPREQMVRRSQSMVEQLPPQ